MNKIIKKLIVGLISLVSLFVFASCDSEGNDADLNAIDTVYVKKGAKIAKDKSEYEEIPYSDLKKFLKLWDGIFVIFKLNSNVYIEDLSFNQDGASGKSVSFGSGSTESLTNSINNLEKDSDGFFNLKTYNNMVIDENYKKGEYFYFYVGGYCEYYNIKINYSNEKEISNDVINDIVRVDSLNYKLSDLKNSIGIEDPQINTIIIGINKATRIKSISLSLKFLAQRDSFIIYNNKPFEYINKVNYSNVSDWYPEYYKYDDNYDFNYELDFEVDLCTFLSNKRSGSKNDVESLNYLNTYNENLFYDDQFEFENASNYQIDNMNYNANAGDYLVININETLKAKTSYKFSLLGTHTQTDTLLWKMQCVGISNLVIEYE